MKQFLPISRADMEAQGIKQLDFVYVIGDAMWIIHPSGTRSSAEYYRQTVLRWESFRSRTGKIRTASLFWASQNLDLS